MTPKEKAIELVEKYLDDEMIGLILEEFEAKQCALLCINEVISQWDYIDTYLADMNKELNPNLKYWYDVKQELSLL